MTFARGLLLGVIAFLLDFVPYIGPFVASLPALLLAFSVSPLTAAWVALLYLVVQQIESYLVTSVVQQRAASLPPVLTLILVFVPTLYLGDVLGDTAEEAPPKRSILVRRRSA